MLGAFILRENDILSAGNITHTPAYGNLIALGVLTAVQSRNASQHQVAEAVAYRELIERTGRFLTYCGGAPDHWSANASGPARPGRVDAGWARVLRLPQ